MATGLVSYGRCFCLISGASRGFGRGLAIKLADKLAPGSVLFLVARNAQDLAEVKTIIDEKKRNLSVVVLSMDLKKPDHEVFKVAINSALKQCDAKADEFNTALVVHNVGSLGNINGTTLDVVDINELRSYYDLNLFATILLNSAFFKIFTASSTGKQVVINLSSGAAVTPFKTWIYYSTGKAARDMFFRVMGAEFPQIRVLNYAPGPMKTEMMTHARENTLDAELRQRLHNFVTDDKLIEVDYSVDRLFLILEADKFQNGDRVSVFDPLP